PSLKPDMTVVMDNLRVHKVEGVVETIEAVDASVLFTPKYSPDLNPIEMFFSKMKSHLRKAMDKTKKSTVRTIRKTIREISDEECVNFIRDAGYGSM
ncbi:MAG: transposase, partial [Alphaproteobacteria bacterium]|nr:transposase [Alphaproteobacteria bacterium]